jgi:hypothetical protein
MNDLNEKQKLAAKQFTIALRNLAIFSCMGMTMFALLVVEPSAPNLIIALLIGVGSVIVVSDSEGK